MANGFNQDEINAIVWKACDTFRGAVDPSEYKNYILTMLFLKYLSDLWKDKQRELHEKYQGDRERIRRALTRERFVVPDECDFDYLYAHRDAPNIGELINVALEKIEDANSKSKPRSAKFASLLRRSHEKIRPSAYFCIYIAASGVGHRRQLGRAEAADGTLGVNTRARPGN